MFRACCIRLFLQSLLYAEFKTECWGRARDCSFCCQFLLNFLLLNSLSFLIKFIANLPFPCLFRWRPEPFKCSDEILPLSIVSIFRELGCLLKFDIFNLAIPLSDLSVMLEWITLDSRNSVWIKFFSDKSLCRMTLDWSLILLFVPTCKNMFAGERFKSGFRKSFYLDSGNSAWIKFFSYKSLFRMTHDGSLILLFVPTCKNMFAGERFKYGFRKSFMSSIVAPLKILTFTEFGFARDSLFSSISWSMESPTINVVSFAHGVGVVGGVLLW